VVLIGPSEQRFDQWLYLQPGTARFAHAMPVPAMLEPGIWRVDQLSIEGFVAGVPRTTIVKYGDMVTAGTFQPSFTVTNAGASDKAAATVELVALSPRPIEAGARLTVQVQLQEPPAGIAQVVVRITSLAQTWPVYLGYRAESGLWQGAYQVPLVGSNGPLTITVGDIEVVSRAGVVSTTSCASLAAVSSTCSVSVVPAQVWPQVQVPPTMPELYHPGGVDFRTWHGLSTAYVESLFDRLDTDPAGVREILYGQLPALGPAIDAVMKEVYVDPQTAFAIAPPSTSGKYFSLGGAARGRWLVLGELDRRELGLALPLVREAFPLHWQYEGDLRPPVSLPVLAEAGGLVTQRVVEIVRDSQIPARIWSQAHAEEFFNLLSLTRRSTVWVHPSAGGPQAGDSSAEAVALFMPGQLPAQGLDVHSIIHELGHNFHMVYVDRPREYHGPEVGPGPLWVEYLGFRGNQKWLSFFDTFWGGRAIENFAEDFARTYKHRDFTATPLETVLRFPQFQDDPTAEATFKAFVARQVAAPPSPQLTLDWAADRVLATLPGPVTIKGTWQPGGSVLVKQSTMETVWMNNSRDGMFGATTADAGGHFSVTLPDGVSPLQEVDIRVMTTDRVIQQFLQVVLFRYPLLLDAVPVQTIEDSVKLTGRTVPGYAVAIQGQPVMVDATGAFTTTQALTEGLNQFRLTATAPTGNDPPSAVVVEIVHGTAEEAAALKDRPAIAGARPLVDPSRLPLAVMERWREVNEMALNGMTLPGAMVTWGDVTVTADAAGVFELRRKTADAIGPAVVTAQLGNRMARWEGVVAETPGGLTPDAAVPADAAEDLAPGVDAAAGVADAAADLPEGVDAEAGQDAGAMADATAGPDGGSTPPPDAAAKTDLAVIPGADAAMGTPALASDDGGCSCAVGRQASGGGSALLGGLLAAIAVTLRSRRRRG
jgi:hypothetical protein